jgi:probable phosphoglycerate mutase
MAEKNFQARSEPGCLRLFLVRHGETEANRLRLIQGSSDGLLNAAGQAQAERLAEHLRLVALDQVFASDMRRATATAMPIAQAHSLALQVDPQLREWDVGELDGMPASQYLQMIRETGRPLSAFHPPGGATLGETRQRAEAVIRRLVEEHRGESVLICSHGDFMRMLVSAILQIDSDAATAFHFDNASYSVFEYKDRQWKALALNRIADQTNK